jgi:hypothetical protein
MVSKWSDRPVDERYRTSVPVETDTLVKTGPGLLRRLHVSCSDAAPTAGTIQIRDGVAAGGGTVIYEFDVSTTWFAPVNIELNRGFTSGLYIDFTTTADVLVAASYQDA